MVRLPMVSLLVFGVAAAAHAQSAGDISDRVVAGVTARGTLAQFDFTSTEGWTCTGKTAVSTGSSKSGKGGSSGGSSSSSSSSVVRLTCSDGTHASARVTRDATRREWDIAFTHRQHGRATLRAVEN